MEHQAKIVRGKHEIEDCGLFFAPTINVCKYSFLYVRSYRIFSVLLKKLDSALYESLHRKRLDPPIIFLYLHSKNQTLAAMLTLQRISHRQCAVDMGCNICECTSRVIKDVKGFRIQSVITGNIFRFKERSFIFHGVCFCGYDREYQVTMYFFIKTQYLMQIVVQIVFLCY